MEAAEIAIDHKDDRRRWSLLRRAQYIGSTFVLELVLVCVFVLVSIVALVFSPFQANVTTSYRVTESLLAQSSMERIKATWTGPGVLAVRPMPDTSRGDDDSCGPYALELETSMRVYAWSGSAPYRGIERAAGEAGLKTPCTGARNLINPTSTFRTTLVAGTGVLALLLMFLAWRSRRGRPWLINWSDWSPRVDSPGALRWGLGVGAVAIAFALGITWLGQLVGLADATESMLWVGKTRAEVLALAPLAVLAAPIAEEYVFRAWMLERFGRVMPTSLALLLIAVGFAALHVPQDIVAALTILGVGLLLGLLWLRTRSWLACAVAHGIYNTAVLIVLMLSLPA